MTLNISNRRWKLEIFTPGRWTSPPEASSKNGTVYRIKLPSGPTANSQINNIKQKKRTSGLNPFIALTAEAMIIVESDEVSTIGRLNRAQLMRDLTITQSLSNETVVRDEETEKKNSRTYRPSESMEFLKHPETQFTNTYLN